MSKRYVKTFFKDQKSGNKNKNTNSEKSRYPRYEDTDKKEPYYHPPIKVGRIVH